jgi:hypothetical protein
LGAEVVGGLAGFLSLGDFLRGLIALGFKSLDFGNRFAALGVDVGEVLKDGVRILTAAAHAFSDDGQMVANVGEIEHDLTTQIQCKCTRHL